MFEKVWLAITAGGTDDNLSNLDVHEAGAGNQPWISGSLVLHRIKGSDNDDDDEEAKGADTTRRPSDDVAMLDAGGDLGVDVPEMPTRSCIIQLRASGP